MKCGFIVEGRRSSPFPYETVVMHSFMRWLDADEWFKSHSTAPSRRRIDRRNGGIVGNSHHAAYTNGGNDRPYYTRGDCHFHTNLYHTSHLVRIPGEPGSRILLYLAIPSMICVAGVLAMRLKDRGSRGALLWTLALMLAICTGFHGHDVDRYILFPGRRSAPGRGVQQFQEPSIS